METWRIRAPVFSWQVPYTFPTIVNIKVTIFKILVASFLRNPRKEGGVNMQLMKGVKTPCAPFPGVGRRPGIHSGPTNGVCVNGVIILDERPFRPNQRRGPDLPRRHVTCATPLRPICNLALRCSSTRKSVHTFESLSNLDVKTLELVGGRLYIKIRAGYGSVHCMGRPRLGRPGFFNRPK
jgi:hypothetical protein